MTANQARSLADKSRLLSIETGGAIADALDVLGCTSRPQPADVDRVARLKAALMGPRV